MMNSTSHSAAPFAGDDSLIFAIGQMQHTLDGRSVGVLVADGSDEQEYSATCQAITDAGAHVMVLAPSMDGATLSDGTHLDVDAPLSGTPSMLFDAVAIILSDAAAERLSADADAIEFVRDAYCNLKTIGVDHGAQGLLQHAGVAQGAGVVDILDSRAFIASAKARQWAYHRSPAEAGAN